MWCDVLCVYRGAQWVPFGHTVFLDVFFFRFYHRCAAAPPSLHSETLWVSGRISQQSVGNQIGKSASSLFKMHEKSLGSGVGSRSSCC